MSSFKELGRDNDDEISYEEADKVPALSDQLKRYDTDHSDAVNHAEVKRMERAE